jgi:hypothetical protein
MFNRQKYLFLLQPLAASFLSSTAFFAIIFLFFRPGYAVNDDISIISLASGYLGAKPLPFMVYSNVLFGFLLNPLYGLAGGVNWEILLFILINFLSVWALVYIFLARLPNPGLKLLGTVTVILCDTYFLINITYTMIAAFASLAGLCLILTTVQSASTLNKRTLTLGCALVLVGSLIRFKSTLLIGAFSLPVLILSYRPAQIKKHVIAFSLLAVFVSSAYVFDRLYLQTAPDWYSYQVYDSVRSQLHDTPRKINIEPAYPQIGWSRNDQKLFFDWFFPDQQIYSLEHLRYLVEHVPGTQTDKVATLTALLTNLFDSVHWPYWLLMLSTWLITLFYGLAKKAGAALLALLAAFFAFAFYFTWAMKIPDRILVSQFAAVVILGLYILAWVGANEPASFSQAGHKRRLPSAVWLAAITVSVAVTFGLVLKQSMDTSQINLKNQAAYQNVLVDIQNLRDNGTIGKNALIISPAYGFPLEWANPLKLSLPKTQVLEMGWLTFSPAYKKVLADFGAELIPEAFYEKDNIYLMTRPASLSEILDFIKEHKGLDVETDLLYQVPGTDIGLYKLRKNP